MYDFFLISYIDYLENIESLNYAHLSYYDTFHYTASKILLLSPPIKKNSKYWEAVKLKFSQI